ncbi:hypothetical protein HQ587_11560 [bacterium]|nr:hypothetical protein [bacterium]
MITLDTAELIRASGETAELLRPSVAGAGGFAGPHEPIEESLGSVPIEFHQLSPDELKQIGADGMCSMLPETDVAEGDILILNEVRYRVSDVKPVNCFGAVSHLIVKLEREYESHD